MSADSPTGVSGQCQDYTCSLARALPEGHRFSHRHLFRNEALFAMIDGGAVTVDDAPGGQAMTGKRVVVAAELGYCWGVRRALEIVEAAAKSAGPIAPIGDVIHNPQVVERLRQTGIEGAGS